MTRPLSDQLDGETLARIRQSLEGVLERCPQYEQAREYDSTDLWQADQDTPQGQLLRQGGLEYDVNYCSPIIDAVSNGMTIDSITAARDDELAEDDTDAGDEAATKLVNAIWRAQKLGQFWPTWQRDSLRDGDGYLMLWPARGAELAEGVAYDPEELNVTYLDPTMGRLFYDTENPRVKTHYAQLWNVPAADGKRVIWRLNLIYPTVVEQYATEPRADKYPKATDFAPYEPDEIELDDYENDDDDQAPTPGVMVNPLGIVPVWHLRTDVNYGRPVHLNAYGPQDAIGETIERMMTTMAFQAWPQTYALQEAENMAQKTIRDDPLADEYDDHMVDFGDDNDPSSIPNDLDVTDTGSQIEMSPGSIAILKNFKAVGQLQAADPNVFLEPWREFAKTAADTTGTPPWTFRAIGSEIPSGVALKIASQPQTARRDRCATLFGDELADLLAFAAEQCGTPDLQVEVKWAPFETVDEVERWTLVKLRTDAGVPLKQALMMAGIPEHEAQEWAAEKEAAAQQEFDRQKELAAKQPPGDRPPAGE